MPIETLEQLYRYERRALSRRNRAVAKLIALRAGMLSATKLDSNRRTEQPLISVVKCTNWQNEPKYLRSRWPLRRMRRPQTSAGIRGPQPESIFGRMNPIWVTCSTRRASRRATWRAG
jgi:hypothetical protein